MTFDAVIRRASTFFERATKTAGSRIHKVMLCGNRGKLEKNVIIKLFIRQCLAPIISQDELAYPNTHLAMLR